MPSVSLLVMYAAETVRLLSAPEFRIPVGFSVIWTFEFSPTPSPSASINASLLMLLIPYAELSVMVPPETSRTAFRLAVVSYSFRTPVWLSVIRTISAVVPEIAALPPRLWMPMPSVSLLVMYAAETVRLLSAPEFRIPVGFSVIWTFEFSPTPSPSASINASLLMLLIP